MRNIYHNTPITCKGILTIMLFLEVKTLSNIFGSATHFHVAHFFLLHNTG